ncbi:ABC transporter permease [Conexibacter woesei]|uniref:ABC3 transporter permease C-terminal domain-containing protein n=1 Tax=Conexibacter woesei (strain DSM 14684 / CCUG 47730 / CIP 108061 / JCM 11494 / NBRC 100937 / ID131577) TaxID=469383 RepID=D3F925_CONWI|nr:ABC transporter permease [Conexibacter woesei]ADB53020.1 protein of unknown function DUF214 [Conexibacter woesei DSM 14684]
MLRLAASTLRARWPALAGAFAALALGAALSIAAAAVIAAVSDVGDRGPQRLRHAPLVVAGTPSLSIPSIPAEERDPATERNPQRVALAPALAARLAALPEVSRAVVDRAFPVRVGAAAQGSGAVPGAVQGAATTGRPWSSRLLTPYRLVAGRPPAAPGEVVAATGGKGGGGAGGIGTQLDATPLLATPAGPAQYRVVGLAAPRDGRGPAYEHPLFFADEEAARLAPRIDAIGIWPAAAAPVVRDLLQRDAPGVVALDGARRGELEPNADADAAAGAGVLLSLMATTVGFVAVFVIASSFAFAVALRRRELGLLRAVGATPRQVRRLVLGEAALFATAAAVVGALASLAVAPLLGGWIADHGLAPAGMRVAPNLLAVALGSGFMVLVALCGAWAAARRAARVLPAEALRDAAVDRGVMTIGRWAVGLPAIGGAVALMQQPVPADPAGQLMVTFGEGALLIVGLTMIAPVLVPPLAALLVLPAARVRGAGPLLVRQHARAAVRRTASTAAPVLVAVGLTAALGSMVGSLEQSDAASVKARFDPRAAVVTAPGGGGLSDADVAALAAIPGAQVAPLLDADVRAIGPEGLGPVAASSLDAAHTPLVLRSPLVGGSLDRLHGDAVALGELTARPLRKRVGDRVRVWLPDGAERELEVVAIVGDGFGVTGMYVPRELLAGHVGGAAATSVHVRLPDGDATAQAALRELTAARGLALREQAGPRKVADVTDSSNMNRLALQAILGVALLYVAIALASTAAVGTVARAGELALLRLSGATPRQVLRLVAAEAFVATAVGALLGLAIAAGMALALRRGFAALTGPAVVAMPWGLLAALSAGCALIAVSASLAAAHRNRPLP